MPDFVYPENYGDMCEADLLTWVTDKLAAGMEKEGPVQPLSVVLDGVKEHLGMKHHEELYPDETIDALTWTMDDLPATEKKLTEINLNDEKTSIKDKERV